jgi:hypothetical protein
MIKAVSDFDIPFVVEIVRSVVVECHLDSHHLSEAMVSVAVPSPCEDTLSVEDGLEEGLVSTHSQSTLLSGTRAAS